MLKLKVYFNCVKMKTVQKDRNTALNALDRDKLNVVGFRDFCSSPHPKKCVPLEGNGVMKEYPCVTQTAALEWLLAALRSKRYVIFSLQYLVLRCIIHDIYRWKK